MHEPTDHITASPPRRWRRRALALLAVASLAVPGAAWAGHQFTDVPNSNTFHDDIDWMADNGVTKGCNPPANDEYCPKDFVTREQMAAFMHRLETEDVFLPTDEAAALRDRFAAINLSGTTLSVAEENGLTSAVRTDTGDYRLTWDESVADCAWTGAINARNGGTQTGVRALSFNSGDATPNLIRVHIETGGGADVDASFSIAIHC